MASALRNGKVRDFYKTELGRSRLLDTSLYHSCRFLRKDSGSSPNDSEQDKEAEGRGELRVLPNTFASTSLKPPCFALGFPVRFFANDDTHSFSLFLLCVPDMAWNSIMRDPLWSARQQLPRVTTAAQLQ